MNYILIENVNALLDSESVANDFETRANYIAEICDMAQEAALMFLQGEEKLPQGKLRALADKFDVEIRWLIGQL